MAFTRYHDDPLRIKKQSEMSSFAGRYYLDTPGPGINLPFFQDPQMRLQRWGANLQTNTVGVENDLFGMTRRLERDPESNNYKSHVASSSMPAYPLADPTVEESRATHPAWSYRSLEHPRWEEPWINPLANLEKKFQDNIQTRILEKDYHKTTVPNYFTTHS